MVVRKLSMVCGVPMDLVVCLYTYTRIIHYLASTWAYTVVIVLTMLIKTKQFTPLPYTLIATEGQRFCSNVNRRALISPYVY